MKAILVTNLADGKGLARDAEIVAARLDALGWEADPLDYRERPRHARADLAIFLETAPEALESIAPVRWLIPNPEWWPQGIPPGAFARILCKSPEAVDAFAAIGGRASYLGFESADRMNAEIPRERKFLHLAGSSSVKGTAVVLEAWRRYRIETPLTVVWRLPVNDPPRQVTVIERLPSVDEAMNRHLFHLCPSEVEGWGHAIHEGLSVGAVVAATDLEPMRTNGVARLMRADDIQPFKLATRGFVSRETVRDTVEWCLGLSEDAIGIARKTARAAYELERDEFRACFEALIREDFA